jgi:hypothetical protein
MSHKLKKTQQKIKNKTENKINNLSKTSVKLYLIYLCRRPYIFISFFEKQKIQHHRSSSKI